MVQRLYCLPWAEDYGVTINVETHGPYTTDGDFLVYVRHCHNKDVSPGLAAAARGRDTGIGTSKVPAGGGGNAENIARRLAFLKETGGSGMVSIECYGSDEFIGKSAHFLRELI